MAHGDWLHVIQVKVIYDVLVMWTRRFAVSNPSWRPPWRFVIRSKTSMTSPVAHMEIRCLWFTPKTSILNVFVTQSKSMTCMTSLWRTWIFSVSDPSQNPLWCLCDKIKKCICCLWSKSKTSVTFFVIYTWRLSVCDRSQIPLWRLCDVHMEIGCLWSQSESFMASLWYSHGY